MKATLQKETRPVNGRPERDEFVAPEVNILETRDGYVLEAEMPGVSKDGLELTLDGTEITIVGRRTPESVVGDPVFRERRLADFRRVFELDPAIDAGRISARIEQGVLTLTLPKSERVKPRKIDISN